MATVILLCRPGLPWVISSRSRNSPGQKQASGLPAHREAPGTHKALLRGLCPWWRDWHRAARPGMMLSVPFPGPSQAHSLGALRRD